MNKNISSCATFLYFIEVFFRSGQFRTAQRWWFLFSEIELVSNPLENQQLPWQDERQHNIMIINLKFDIIFLEVHIEINIIISICGSLQIFHSCITSQNLYPLLHGGLRSSSTWLFPMFSVSSSSFSHLPRHCLHPSYQKKKKKKRGS